MTINSGGTVIYATINGGYVYRSTSLPTLLWKPLTTSGLRNWTAISCDSTGTDIVACATGGQIYTSSDGGNTWNPRDSART